MRAPGGVVLAGLACVSVALGIVSWIEGGTGWLHAKRTDAAPHKRAQPAPSDSNKIITTFPDPNSPHTDQRVFINLAAFDSGVYKTAADAGRPVRDARSLEELRDSILNRSSRGLGYWRARDLSLVLDSPPSPDQATAAIRIWRAIAFLAMYDGNFAEAKTWLEKGLALCRTPGIDPQDRAYVRALLGIAALRRGEIENRLECLGPSSRIFPLDSAAVH
jgi:hypothetical protein